MAKYQRRKISVDNEMNIAIGCIVSNTFARDFIALIGNDINLMQSKYLRTITQWAIDYYTSYGKVCMGSITDIFKAEQEQLAEEDSELIENALENVNNKYIEDKANFDAEYIYGQVEKYIRKRSLETKVEKVKGFLSQDKILEAEREYSDFTRKEKGEVLGIDIFSDMEAVDECFQEEESVFTMDGALGTLFGNVFYGDLIYVGGASKTSKTWTTMEIAHQCVAEGKHVAWFSLEMSSRLMNKRFAQKVGGGSFRAIEDKVYIPSFDKNNNITYKKEKVRELTPNSVKRKYKMFKRQNKGRLVIYDNTSAGNTINAIKNTILTAEEMEGIKYDVVIIDQLNLIKSFSKGEKRHQLDSIALDLKREIAQELNTLVISPIQYNRASLQKDTNDESSISEAYSLFTHCSLLISLNQSKLEKEKGIMRITATGRHSFHSGAVVVLQCLDVGKAIIDSRWLKDVPNYNDVTCNQEFGDEDEMDLNEV